VCVCRCIHTIYNHALIYMHLSMFLLYLSIYVSMHTYVYTTTRFPNLTAPSSSSGTACIFIYVSTHTYMYITTRFPKCHPSGQGLTFNPLNPLTLNPLPLFPQARPWHAPQAMGVPKEKRERLHWGNAWCIHVCRYRYVDK